MKKRVLLLCLCFLCTASFAQDSAHYFPFWTQQHLYQRAGIKEEGIFHYYYKKGKLYDSALIQTFVYDSLGRVVRQQDFFRNKLRTQFTYYYSARGLDSTIQEEPWIPAIVAHKYRYDSAGNLRLQETFHRGIKTMHFRYVYNRYAQPVERYTQYGNRTEFLSAHYQYRPDKLIQQIDYRFGPGKSRDDFSWIYTYARNQTATRSFQRAAEDNRYIDCINTYNERQQLIEKISPPLPKMNWMPPGLHSRREEWVETSVYHPNGMLYERQRRSNEELLVVERHFYF